MKHGFWVLPLICVLASACDIAYSPVLCNGFDQTVYVKAIWLEGKRSASTTIDAKKCETLNMLSEGKREVDGVHAQGVATGSVTIFSLQNEVLGIYEGAANKATQVGLNHTPHWLISKDGFFHIPHDQASDWERSIDGIQKNAVVFFPNLLK